MVPQKPLDLVLPSDVFPKELKRYVSTGSVTVEMVGSFGRTWKLGRGDRAVRGVVFKPRSIRFAHARTGKTLGDVKLR